jgi:hypothetical protein
LKFCLLAVGIFGFLVFESSREALKDRSEDEVCMTMEEDSLWSRLRP